MTKHNHPFDWFNLADYAADLSPEDWATMLSVRQEWRDSLDIIYRSGVPDEHKASVHKRTYQTLRLGPGVGEGSMQNKVWPSQIECFRRTRGLSSPKFFPATDFLSRKSERSVMPSLNTIMLGLPTNELQTKKAKERLVEELTPRRKDVQRLAISSSTFGG